MVADAVRGQPASPSMRAPRPYLPPGAHIPVLAGPRQQLLALVKARWRMLELRALPA